MKQQLSIPVHADPTGEWLEIPRQLIPKKIKYCLFESRYDNNNIYVRDGDQPKVLRRMRETFELQFERRKYYRKGFLKSRKTLPAIPQGRNAEKTVMVWVDGSPRGRYLFPINFWGWTHKARRKYILKRWPNARTAHNATPHDMPGSKCQWV